uniref:Enoyl reductase (ER) domain-containing protein n=1 Tax=Globisporangium ultimum (strain ATCC 200006 / CBS 805.95 / DAOM BR144) TaxID=431595 RepID=K3WJC0_GLOUD
MSSIPATFRAYRYQAYGAPDQVLELRSDVSQAPLAPTQVRVKVHSAAINPVDVKLTTGHERGLLSESPTSSKPFGIGFDGAGTVVEVGSAVREDGDGALHVGDAVYFMTSFSTFGSFAEYLTVDQSFVARKPATLSFDQAASVPLVGLTSYQALVEHAKLQKGERVLILGGSSATGIYAIQIAKAVARTSPRRPARGTPRSSSRSAPTKSSSTRPQTCCARALVARHAVSIADPKAASKHGAKLVGSILVYPSASHLTELTRLIEDGKIVTPIDSVHRFENVLDAVARISSRRATGKVVIQVAPDA